MKLGKRLAALLLTAALTVTSLGGLAPAEVKAAATVNSANMPVISSTASLDSVSALYTQKADVTNDAATNDTDYFKFTLSQDSWVLLRGSYSLYNTSGGSTHVSIYSDSSYSNQKMEYDWGYFEYGTQTTAFLPKGTYYGVVTTKLGNYDSFVGNVNVIGAAIPLTKVFKFTTKYNKYKTQATVTMTDALGEYAKRVQYRKGAVSNTKVNDKTYWKWFILTDYAVNGEGATVIKPKSNKYTVKVKTNATYTFMLEDTEGNRYSKTVKVNGLDKKKPVVTGVKNKKTYKKTVTIKFSDKQTGIKSATLNGKKIKNKKKVSKNGSYSLVVRDKAGNKTTIKFKIKK